MASAPVTEFLEHHFRHFNAATVVEAARGWSRHVDDGGSMLLTVAGAMSTAEIGLSLAEMIRRRKVHAISCTGANLEEDLFNLVGHHGYERVPGWRDLTPEQEQELLERGMNRVTDTCIPEDVMRAVEAPLIREWRRMDRDGERAFPHELLYRLIRDGALAEHYEVDPSDSWLVAAAEADLPMVVPGWEDSTLGNMFAAQCLLGHVGDPTVVRSGIEYMTVLADWYRRTAPGSPVGFFQIGGGIAGDFPICAVPMLHQDMKLTDVPMWAYFCQISDSTTSYGSYSGAIPNEKITWGKLSPDTPRYVIESDAAIVAPLVFAHVLGW